MPAEENRSRMQALDNRHWRALALLAVTLVLAMSTWFSASAVIPQLRDAWQLSPTTSAWLTIAVQIGFVCGAIMSSVLNYFDPRGRSDNRICRQARSISLSGGNLRSATGWACFR